jgi:hypothetical protein
MHMSESGQGNLSLSVLRHSDKNEVSKFHKGLLEQTGTSIGEDYSERKDQQSLLKRQLIDCFLVEKRHINRHYLGQRQTRQRENYSNFEIQTSLGPEIDNQGLQGSQVIFTFF